MPVTSAARSRVRISDGEIGFERMSTRAPRRTGPLVTAATVTVSEGATASCARALEPGVVAEKVRNLPGAEGLNAATGEYEDLLVAGINDPVKVTRSALQNAASIAALFLTTEAVVADKPEPAAPAMPGGDEMGGMGF